MANKVIKTVKVTRLITNDQIERDALRAWKRMSRQLLNDRVEPKTPLDTRELRQGLWVKTFPVSSELIRSLFASKAWYWFRYETDEDWMATHTLHTPGTRMPFITLAINESDDLIEQAIKDMINGR